MYEGSLCVCCMSTDNLVELFNSRKMKGVEENYAKMFSTGLNMQISQIDGHESICEACADRLRDCIAFKRQALTSLCIISSVDITEYVSHEDIEVLGLGDQKEKELSVEVDKLPDVEEEEKELPNAKEEAAKKRKPGRPRKLRRGTLPYNNSKCRHCGEDLRNNLKVSRTHRQGSICKCTNQPSDSAALKRQSPTTLIEISPVIKECESPNSKKAVKKRKPGRPRKHPRDFVLYKIDKDEMKCRECGEEFPNNVTLKVHYNVHFGRHKCSTCNKGFMTLTSLKKHETTHLVGPFRCPICKEEYRNLNTLNSHKRYKHSKSMPFRCVECTEEFPTLQRRLAHYAVTHARTERRYACRYCDRRFRYSGERARHIADKHEVIMFPCPLCGVKYRKTYMRAHLVRRHGVGRGHTCALCSAVKPTRSALDKHMLSHLDKRRFVCRLCSKAFVQKCTLQSHIISHIRRGQYRGNPKHLIVYRDDPDAENNGILSESESQAGEIYLDENLLCEDQSIDLNEDIDGILLDDDLYELPSDLDEES